MATLEEIEARVAKLETRATSANKTMAYCKNGLLAAIHDSAQAVDPVIAYGSGTTMMEVDPSWVLERVGDPPPEGLLDIRPYKCPFGP